MLDDYTRKSGIGPLRAELIEPILLFAVFFLPAYLLQNQSVDPSLFDSPLFHGIYFVQTLPMILFLLFLLSRKGPHWWIPYRITRFRTRDIGRGVVIWLAVWAVLIPFFLLISLLNTGLGEEAVGVPWNLSSPAILPLVFSTCLLTGYWEELFFRAYLDGQFKRLGLSPARAAVAGVLLFASGHLYQGLIPALGTAIIGAVLLYAFRRTRSLHAVALGHAFYNFSVLALSLYVDFG